ncbi:twin-arginine translocase subunit TatC [Candidatus Auribacterota bacterium]
MKKKDDLRSAGEKTFLEHLEELRFVFLKSFLALMIFTGLGFVFAPAIIKMLVWPLDRVLQLSGAVGTADGILRTLRPTGGFMVGLKAAFLFGIVVSLPFILYFFAKFLVPGLTGKERRVVVPSFLMSFMLFLGGASFCYFVILPFALKFFWNYSARLGIRNDWIIENYVSFTVQFLVAFGLVFEIPCVVLALVKVGILSHRTLRRNRKFAIVAVFVLAAAVTPTPDIITQILVAGPMLALYELCVWAAKIVEGKKTGEDAPEINFGNKDLKG